MVGLEMGDKISDGMTFNFHNDNKNCDFDVDGENFGYDCDEFQWY